LRKKKQVDYKGETTYGNIYQLKYGAKMKKGAGGHMNFDNIVETPGCPPLDLNAGSTNSGIRKQNESKSEKPQQKRNFKRPKQVINSDDDDDGDLVSISSKSGFRGGFKNSMAAGLSNLKHNSFIEA
jgi:hypothetical protein